MKYVSDTNLGKFLQKLKGIFAKKSEVPSQADVDSKLPLAGGTMTGDITFKAGQEIKVANGAGSFATMPINTSAGVILGDSSTLGDMILQTASGKVLYHRRGSSGAYEILDKSNGLPLSGGTMTGAITGPSGTVLNNGSGSGALLSGNANYTTLGNTNTPYMQFNTGNTDIRHNRNGTNYFILDGYNTDINPALTGAEGNIYSLKMLGTNYGIQALSCAVLTTAPTAANTDGLKIVVLSSEPVTKYAGYLYIVTGA